MELTFREKNWHVTNVQYAAYLRCDTIYLTVDVGETFVSYLELRASKRHPLLVAAPPAFAHKWPKVKVVVATLFRLRRVCHMY